jgi:hypothetical protein
MRKAKPLFAKGEDSVKRIAVAHREFTTAPIVGDNHFPVAREVDITVQGPGRIQINELMLYEINEGKIVSEQFFTTYPSSSPLIFAPK